jgi:hypothetical protein
MEARHPLDRVSAHKGGQRREALERLAIFATTAFSPSRAVCVEYHEDALPRRGCWSTASSKLACLRTMFEFLTLYMPPTIRSTIAGFAVGQANPFAA